MYGQGTENRLRPFFVIERRTDLNHRARRIRRRTCAAIAALYAARRRAEAAKVIGRAVRTGTVPQRTLAELLLHLSLFLGYPVAFDGLETLASLRTGRTRSRSIARTGCTNGHRGRRVFKRVYGTQTEYVLAYLDDLWPGLAARVLSDAYGAVMARPGLSLQERELINVVTLAVLNYPKQLTSHLRGALRLGVSRDELVAALRQTRRVSGRRMEAACLLLNALAKVRTKKTRSQLRAGAL